MTDSVTLSLSSVYWTAPYLGREQSQKLSLRNEGKEAVIFKMKSTRPHRFRMRPVFGTLAPNGGHAQVTFSCRPFDNGATGLSKQDRFTTMLALRPTDSPNDALTEDKAWKLLQHPQRPRGPSLPTHSRLRRGPAPRPTTGGRGTKGAGKQAIIKKVISLCICLSLGLLSLRAGSFNSSF
ncbi:MAG: motile sperm domain-containing protein [Deltaproteobacteria bacterium]|nr:motile sperm domain-containing protein [Deltaproteobacteria bacterium]